MTGWLRKLMPLGCLVVTAFLVNACAGSGTGSGGAPAASSSPSAPLAGEPSGARTGGGYGYGGGGSGSPGPMTNVQQGRGGLVFSPSSVSVRQGAKILVSNVAYIQHTFTVPGTEVNVVNDPLQYQDVPITLAPGTYTFVCTFHQSQGMKGTLTVTS
jgi:plastocyanin